MTTEATLKIPALHCSSCASTVSRRVKALGGVSEITVDTESKLVNLTYDESEVTLDRIRESLDEIGYFAED
ncbi:MAG: heavy-metal-associated domain-containing protein [Chloroflexi bacterium]|nr:heavy-metal-associated domain-containing protein [Chloroflexota bacterium]